jgi:hypothetical protein
VNGNVVQRRKEDKMNKQQLISYCGLYCDLCAERKRIPERTKELIAAMEIEGYPNWAKHRPEFKEFWAFVNRLAEGADKRCCRSGTCGAHFCTIRKCVKERGLEMCDQCQEFPCKRVKGIAKGYPTLLHDAERRRKIGIEAWVAEQQKRLSTGFQYADIRCYPYDVPSE